MVRPNRLNLELPNSTETFITYFNTHSAHEIQQVISEAYRRENFATVNHYGDALIILLQDPTNRVKLEKIMSDEHYLLPYTISFNMLRTPKMNLYLHNWMHTPDDQKEYFYFGFGREGGNWFFQNQSLKDINEKFRKLIIADNLDNFLSALQELAAVDPNKIIKILQYKYNSICTEAIKYKSYPTLQFIVTFAEKHLPELLEYTPIADVLKSPFLKSYSKLKSELEKYINPNDLEIKAKTSRDSEIDTLCELFSTPELQVTRSNLAEIITKKVFDDLTSNKDKIKELQRAYSTLIGHSKTDDAQGTNFADLPFELKQTIIGKLYIPPFLCNEKITKIINTVLDQTGITRNLAVDKVWNQRAEKVSREEQHDEKEFTTLNCDPSAEFLKNAKNDESVTVPSGPSSRPASPAASASSQKDEERNL